MTKQGHMIRVDDAVWAALTEAAQEKKYDYRGRLNQGRVVEDLVRGVRPAEPSPPPAPPPPPVQPEPRQAPADVAPQQWRLADIVTKWPDKVQQQWQQDEWKAGSWVKRVIDTINAGL